MLQMKMPLFYIWEHLCIFNSDNKGFKYPIKSKRQPFHDTLRVLILSFELLLWILLSVTFTREYYALYGFSTCMNFELLASILTYWRSKIKYDFLVAVLARTFVNILNLLLSLYYLVFCESQCHCGYIDMFSFQLFTNIICKNTDIRDNAVTMATLIWIFSSVYTQMVFNMSTIL